MSDEPPAPARPETERPARAPSWARDHLANERTLLAWVRTSVAFMGFGVAIAKLSMLLQIDVLEHPQLADQLPSIAVSQLVGGGLVALGGLVAVLGAMQARHWAKRVAGDPPNAGSMILTVGLAIATSVVLMIYLLA